MPSANKQPEVLQSIPPGRAQRKPVTQSANRAEGPKEQCQKARCRRRKNVVRGRRRGIAELMRARRCGRTAGGKENGLDAKSPELLAFAPKEDVRLPGEFRHQIAETKRVRHGTESVTKAHEGDDPHLLNQYFASLALNVLRPHQSCSSRLFAIHIGMGKEPATARKSCQIRTMVELQNQRTALRL